MQSLLAERNAMPPALWPRRLKPTGVLTNARLAVLILAACAYLPFTASSFAKDGPSVVDAELVLAVDISNSMDTEEQLLQAS